MRTESVFIRRLPVLLVAPYAAITTFLAVFGNEWAALVPFTLTFPVGFLIEGIDSILGRWLFMPAVGEPTDAQYRAWSIFVYALYLVLGSAWFYGIGRAIRFILRGDETRIAVQ